LRESRGSSPHVTQFTRDTTHPTAYDEFEVHAIPSASFEHSNHPNTFVGTGNNTFKAYLGTWESI
jgi:hypothetical protein